MSEISGEYRVDNSPFSIRTSNCLKNAGIQTLNQLLSLNESLLLKQKNIGRKSLNEIRDFMSDHELAYGTQLLDIDKSETVKYDFDYDTSIKELKILQDKHVLLNAEIAALNTHIFQLNKVGLENSDSPSNKLRYPTIFSGMNRREHIALKHRIDGKTYALIGEAMSISLNRARVIVEGCYGKLRQPARRHLQEQVHDAGICKHVSGNKCKYCMTDTISKNTSLYPLLSVSEKIEYPYFAEVIKTNYINVKDETLYKLCSIASDMQKYIIQNANGTLTDEKFNSITDHQEKQIQELIKDLPGVKVFLPYSTMGISSIIFEVPTNKIGLSTSLDIPAISINKFTLSTQESTQIIPPTKGRGR